MTEYKKPTYVNLYELTQEGEKLARKGTPFEDMIEHEHYKLFTIMTLKELTVYNIEHKLAEIIYKKR